MPAFLKYIEGALGNKFTGDQFTKTTTQGAPFESDIQTQYGLLDYNLDMDQLSKAYNLEFFEDSERSKDFGKGLDPYSVTIREQNIYKIDALIGAGFKQGVDFGVGRIGTDSEGQVDYSVYSNPDNKKAAIGINNIVVNAFDKYTKEVNSSESAMGAVPDSHVSILGLKNKDIGQSAYAVAIGNYYKQTFNSLRSDIENLTESYGNTDESIPLIIQAMNANVPETFVVSQLQSDSLEGDKKTAFLDNLTYRYLSEAFNIEDLSQFDTYQQGIRELTNEKKEVYNKSVIQKYFPDQPGIGFEIDEDTMGSDFEKVVKSYITTSDDDEQFDDLTAFFVQQTGVELDPKTIDGVAVMDLKKDDTGEFIGDGDGYYRMIEEAERIIDTLPKFIDGQSTTQSDKEKGEGFPEAFDKAKERIDPEKDAIENWLNKDKVLSVSEIQDQEGVSFAQARKIFMDENGSAFNQKYDLKTGRLRFKDPEKPNHVLPRKKYQGNAKDLWDELYSKSHNEDGTPKADLNEVFN